MRVKRVPYCKTANFYRISHTQKGANTKLVNYVGQNVNIIKFSNLYNSINNVYVQTEDGYGFWCNYKDLKDIEIGLNLTIKELEIEMSKSLGSMVSNNNELYNIIFKILWEIEYSNLKFDTLLKDICQKFKITENIILEIYFLFYYNNLNKKG